ncbi:MAG: class I SAM-dependent methyltransferase [Elusimicrobia bacterium]|nr:class I SAM-dependent methyltransferase [Elusimicrobiota bacterium]
MTTFFFRIREEWTVKLALAAVPFALAYSASVYWILPLKLGSAPKAWLSCALGFGLAGVFLFRQKRAHLRRHIAEAGFLGFRCAVKGRLWNPLSMPELTLEKDAGDPGRDRLLGDLVRMSGLNYGVRAYPPPRGSDIAALAAVAAVFLLRAFPGLTFALLPFFGLMALLFTLSKTEYYFDWIEYKCLSGEYSSFQTPGAGYIQWNFLTLEHQRLTRKAGALLKTEVGEILTGKAALAGGAAVLEVGSGGGFLWKILPGELKPGWTQVEKDPHAALYSELHGNGRRLFSLDVKDLPFADGSFDAIVGLECFDSLSPADLAGLLEQAKRLLKPGGKLVHLKDFPDWPAGPIAEKLNLFSVRALNKKLVAINRRDHFFKFSSITGAELAGLRAAAEKEQGAEKAYARVLAALYHAGAEADNRRQVPMLVSLMILKELMVSAGFEMVTDSLAPENKPTRTAYLIAQKPV